MNKKVLPVLFAGAMLLAFTGQAMASPMLHTVDFINDALRTNFNGFEGADGSSDHPSLYSEDGVIVEQIKPGSAGILTTYALEGVRGWSPNNGDNFYTSITREGSADFFDVGFLVGSGNSSHNTFLFELYDDGDLILSSSLYHQSSAHYIGFSGGGFDTILLRDGNNPWGTFYDGTSNALVLDSIELFNSSPVPEPATMLLLGSGLLGFAVTRKKKES